MFLARIKGHIVATAKDPSVKGQKLLIVEPLKVDYDATASDAAGGDNPGGGRFEVTVDGNLVFSKLKEGRFPEDEEIMAHLN